MTASALWQTWLIAVSGAAAASLVTFIVTGGRLRRIGGRAKKCGKCVWTHTNIVVYLAIAATVATSYWQIRLVHQEAARARAEAVRTRAALCFFRTDLDERLTENIFKLRHARQLGLPPAAVIQLQLMVTGQQATIRSLKGLPCS